MKMQRQISLKSRALRYLSMREHSRQELGRKLARYVQEGDEVESLLDWLQAEKMLSDSRFTEALVHRRAKRFGNSRILHELQSHGIEGEAFRDAKEKLAEDESARAFEVWRKKFGARPADASERARQMRFLLQRGFSNDAIRAVMRADQE